MGSPEQDIDAFCCNRRILTRLKRGMLIQIFILRRKSMLVAPG